MHKFLITTLAISLLVGCQGSLEDGISGDYRFETRAPEKSDPALSGGGGVPNMTITFNKDKTITSPGAPREYSGTWQLQGEEVNLVFAGQQMKGKVRHGGKEIEITELGGVPPNGNRRIFLMRQ